MFYLSVLFVYFVILYRIMMNTRFTNTEKPFEIPRGGGDKISQMTPASRADEFRTTEANGKDGLLKVPRKNSGTKLDLHFGTGIEAKASLRKQMNKEMVDSRGEKIKPGVLLQAQVNKMHKDLHYAFETIFQAKLFK